MVFTHDSLHIVICERSETIQNPSAERRWIASSQGLLAMTECGVTRSFSNSHLSFKAEYFRVRVLPHGWRVLPDRQRKLLLSAPKAL
ncbi:hypothetical protein SAMN05216525_10762 [Bradyrhizobium sp. Gha]|nr:hypothetical protein SAMN05216525_10762 [Bradyrhizobium sp. Gha]